MTEIRYAELHASPPLQTVQTVGTAAGPSGGDNWTQLASLPENKMAGTSQYAVIVTGKIGNIRLVGTGASKGMVQVCLGTTAGTRLADCRVAIPVQQASVLNSPLLGLSFQFLVLISSAFPDPVLGSSFNPSGSQLCLFARTYTNGDAQTYAVQFDVADVNWLWFDLGEIPSGHWEASTMVGTNPFPTTVPTTWQQLGPTFGGAGQQWLHFSNVWYETLSNALSPRFSFGISADGTSGSIVKKVGNSGRWGRNRTPLVAGSTETANVQVGCFWTHTNAGATTKWGYNVWEPAPATSVGKRWRHLAIRIDPLTDVRVRQQAGPDLIAQSIAVPTWPDQFLTIERPAVGLLTEPIVLAHGTVHHNPPPLFSPTAAYGCRIFEFSPNDPIPIGDLACFPQSDAWRGEAASSMAFGRRTFQTLSPAMQWRVSFPGDDVFASPVLQQVFDFAFVAFHPVRDPENVTTGPGSPLPPLLLVPGKQSPDPGSLSAPPHAPSGDPLERGNLERNEIRGGTGYARGWPMGAKALRVMTVNWGPLSETDAAALFTFLRDTPAWRYTPPRSPALAVLTISRPEMSPTSHRTFSITVDVAVLVWTGA